MKLLFVISTLSLVVAQSLAADGVTCDLKSLTPLLTDPDLTTCAKLSGLTFPPPSLPTAEQLQSVCAIPSCVALVGKVAALNLGDCTIGPIKLNSDLLVPLKGACANNATSATTAPITTTGDVAASHAGSGAGHNATSVHATTPTVATAVPAPVKSAASRPFAVAATTVVVLAASAMH